MSVKVKKNFFYSTILVVANYLFPILTFPYTARILGPQKIGIFNFVDSIINYYILFSMMGIGAIGIRIIAKNKLNAIELNQAFSSLFCLNAISTVIIFVIFNVSVYTIEKFSDYKEMLYIGGIKIISNLFLIEWFYKGIENFKYVTVRSIIIKTLYIVSIFMFVKKQEDYMLYYILTILSVVGNAAINWRYKHFYVKFEIRKASMKPILKSFFTLGAYILLTSMYTTFNITYLGIISGDEEVGYYTTATKIYSFLLALFTSFTGVMLPRISSLVNEGNINKVKEIIDKSFHLLFTFSFPIITFSVILAPEIITIMAGEDYTGAIVPMRIIMPLILIVGMEQIFIIQLLMPLNDDRSILYNSIIGAAIGILLNILLVSPYKSTGSSIVWLISEIAVLISASYFVKKRSGILLPYNEIAKNILYSIPYAIIIYFISLINLNDLHTIIISIIASLLYFLTLQVIILKNTYAIDLLKYFTDALLVLTKSKTVKNY